MASRAERRGRRERHCDDRLLSGIWRNHLRRELLWFAYGPGPGKGLEMQELKPPSWSWTSINRRVLSLEDTNAAFSHNHAEWTTIVSKTLWQRANNAEQRTQCLEIDLAKANSELQEARNTDKSISTLQQQLDASLESGRNAEREIENLRAALTTSDNSAKEVHQQAIEHIQTLTEEGDQKVQRLNELGAMVEARRIKRFQLEPPTDERSTRYSNPTSAQQHAQL